MVRVTGFEPAASCSQSTRATNCATPGYSFFSFCRCGQRCGQTAVFGVIAEAMKCQNYSVFKASGDFGFCSNGGGVTCSQTKRATICATPRCSVLKAGVSHKTYYTPEGEKMSSVGTCKNALTNPARSNAAFVRLTRVVAPHGRGDFRR